MPTRLALVLLLLLATGCRSIVEYDPSVRFAVTGRTIDEQARPVSAVVTVEEAPERQAASIRTSSSGEFTLDLAQGTHVLSFQSGELATRRWVDLHADLVEPSDRLDLGDVQLLPMHRVTLAWESPARRRVVLITDEDEQDQFAAYGQARSLDGTRAAFDYRGRSATIGVLELETMAVTRHEVEFGPTPPDEIRLGPGEPVDWIELRCADRPTQQWPWSVDRDRNGWRFEVPSFDFTEWESNRERVTLTPDQRMRLSEALRRIFAGTIFPPALAVGSDGEVVVGSVSSEALGTLHGEHSLEVRSAALTERDRRELLDIIEEFR